MHFKLVRPRSDACNKGWRDHGEDFVVVLASDAVRRQATTPRVGTAARTILFGRHSALAQEPSCAINFPLIKAYARVSAQPWIAWRQRVIIRGTGACSSIERVVPPKIHSRTRECP